MGFDYGFTCGDIDREIDVCKGEVHKMLVEALVDACPLMSDEERDKYATTQMNAYSNELEKPFEKVRELNQDMRKEAESQIDDLECRIQDLEAELANTEV